MASTARVTPASTTLRLVLAAAVWVVLSACGGSKQPSTSTGAITVRGTEKLVWNQDGDLSGLSFRAYVDDRLVPLDRAACDGSTDPATCTSPLPPLADGVNTIALSAFSTVSGLESVRSEPITVQKVSSTAALPLSPLAAPTTDSSRLRLQRTVSTADGLTFALDVVADDVTGPARLAWAPDGRLFVAEANGRIRVMWPDGASTDASAPAPPDRRPVVAFDARTLLDAPPLSAPALTLHPDFARNHFVYVSFVVADPRQQPRFVLFRLREVGNSLGEPMMLLETHVVPSTLDGPRPARSSYDAPRAAVGPDGLLYVALPPGLEFDESSVGRSAPHPAMLRVRVEDAGRLRDDATALAGVTSHPLAFAWHPATRDLWAAFPDQRGDVLVAPLSARDAPAPSAGERVLIRASGAELSAGALVFHSLGSGAEAGVTAFLAIPELRDVRVLSLSEPAQDTPLSIGAQPLSGELVSGPPGTLFLGVRDGSGKEGERDVILRLSRRE